MSDKRTSDLLPFGLAAMALLAISFLSHRTTAAAPPPPEDPPTIEQQEVYVSIWKTTVDTQMHFNEMSVKARQFGLTFVAAALGLGVALMSRDKEPTLSVSAFGRVDFEVHAIVLLVIASAFALYSVKQLDLKVYHKMLRGAVAFGEDLEENYMKRIFHLDKGMTQAISHFSRHEDAGVLKGSNPYQYTGVSRKTAFEKVSRFYTVAISTLSVLAVLLFIATAHFDFHLHQAPAVQAPVPPGAPVIPEAPRGTNAK